MITSKIFESSSAATVLEFNAARREIDWQNFVSGVPSCAPLAIYGYTFDCLREADTSEIFNGLQQSIAEAQEVFVFVPGHGGLFPKIASKLIKTGHFARLLFIAGTNSDEGSY